MESKPHVLMHRYELGRLLGQGTFGKVYYARSTITNHSVAIKVIDKDKVMKTGQAEQIKLCPQKSIRTVLRSNALNSPLCFYRLTWTVQKHKINP